jgi:hypothetical protein
VLCDLEGNTRQEAAKRLGWPEVTVASRLVSGRALLAKRLIRSAQVFSGVVTMTLASGAEQAALPSTLVQSTVRAAVLVAAGTLTAQGVLSAHALILAKGVIQSMLWNKLKRSGVGAGATEFYDDNGDLPSPWPRPSTLRRKRAVLARK